MLGRMQTVEPDHGQGRKVAKIRLDIPSLQKNASLAQITFEEVDPRLTLKARTCSCLNQATVLYLLGKILSQYGKSIRLIY